MRTRLAIVLGTLVALASLTAAGCGGNRADGSTPVACLEGPNAYLKALQAAPGAVRLGGETPISGCLTENQQPGELATVGEAMVETATRLNAQGRAEEGGRAAVGLGYLLGAVERGASATEGIHSELVRRLVVAARFSPGRQPLSLAFLRAYRTGYAAGHSAG
ncbi:MAG TPA: hypothetical protein VF731_11615 [Solirubrobacterales bacterium]